MRRLLETVVGGEAVADQPAGEVQADEILQHVGTAAAVDDVARGLIAHRHVKPDGSSPLAPSRLVGHDDLGMSDRVLDLVVGGFKPVGTSQHDPGRRARRQVDAVNFAEIVGDLAVGHAHALVEVGHAGLNVGTELARRGSGRVGGLQGMPAADALLALSAGSLVDAELAANGFGRQVGLKLFLDGLIFGDRSAAVRTGIRQRSLQRVDDLLGSGRGTMGVRAVFRTAFASGLFGDLLGFALGERGGLAFGSPLLQFQPTFEFGNAGRELVDKSEQRHAARTVRIRPRLLHLRKVSKPSPYSCAKIHLAR